MRLKQYIIILIIITVINFPIFTLAQQDTTEIEMVHLELTDGSTIVGNIIEEDESTLTIKTLANLEIKVPKENIIEREIITGQINEGEFWNSDPNKTRMFFAPTGKSPI